MHKCKEFLIYDQDKPIAILKNPYLYDQPWVFYDLEAICSDNVAINRLYSEEFWDSDEIQFCTKENLITCEFFLPVIITEDDPDNPAEEIEVSYSWSDEKGKMVSLKDRPNQLVLRGPYLEEGRVIKQLD